MTEQARGRVGFQITWTTSALIVLAVMLIGIALALQMPVWLAPPLIFYTHIMYEFLALAWLPVFVVLAIMRPVGNPRTARVVLALGIAALLYCGFAIVFNMNAEFGPGARALQHCEHENSKDDFAQYSCTFAGFSEGPFTVMFEGFRDSPFVWKARIQ
jgi:hypothetical protein